MSLVASSRHCVPVFHWEIKIYSKCICPCGAVLCCKKTENVPCLQESRGVAFFPLALDVA